MIPTGFEYERLVRGLDHFGVTKIILLRGTGDFEEKFDPYVRKIRERYFTLDEEGRIVELRLNLLNVVEVARVALRISLEVGNRGETYFCITSAPKVTEAGLLIAAMVSPVRPRVYYVASRERLLARLESASLLETRGLRTYLLERGSAWGPGEIVEIPVPRAALPSRAAYLVLREVSKAGGGISLKELVERIASGERPKSPKKGAVASRLSYHLSRLEQGGLIRRVREGREIRVELTLAGELYFSLMSVLEEAKRNLQLLR